MLVDGKTGHVSYSLDALELLERAGPDHWWFRARNRVIVDLFRRYVPSAAHVIEVGAGPGIVASALVKAGYRVAVADVYPEALEHCLRRGLTEQYLLDMNRPSVSGQFDCVGMFDVLEHLEDDVGAVTATAGMLRGGGRVVVTVPAGQALWSQSDVVAGHKRRYSPSGLCSLFRRAGFRVLFARAFFSVLLPGLCLRRLFLPGTRRDRYKMDRKSSGLTRFCLPELRSCGWFLSALLTAEYGLLRKVRVPAGASLALVAEKLDSAEPRCPNSESEAAT